VSTAATPLPRVRRSARPATAALGRSIYTTGQAAKLCLVAPRTIVKWIEAGRLKCYRIPGSQDRRIRRQDLARFVAENGLPVPPELADLAGRSAVLLVGLPPVAIENARVTAVPDAFNAGAAAVDLLPAVVVVDARGMGRIEAGNLAAAAAALPCRPTCLVVGHPAYGAFAAEVAEADLERAVLAELVRREVM
jgi:excisionase family DNA binding protein